jgi:hypothetical protein
MKHLLLLLALALTPAAQAFPPAPFHRVYGVLRDDRGNPLQSGAGIVILSGAGNQEIVRAPSDTSVGPGLNYSLSVPMDAATTPELYTVSALRPSLPFTIRVVRNGVSFVPIQMVGATWTIGEPGAMTRLDLTLGIDSDGDGLPDAWEMDIINSDQTGRFRTLADISPGADIDGDGLTNMQEYIAGTYALEKLDGLRLEILGIANGLAHLRFVAVTGRTYQIKGSPALDSPVNQPFSREASGASPTAFFRSPDVRIVDAYVPVGEASSGFFRLYAE